MVETKIEIGETETKGGCGCGGCGCGNKDK